MKPLLSGPPIKGLCNNYLEGGGERGGGCKMGKICPKPSFDNILNEVIKIGKDAITGHLVNLFSQGFDNI